MSTEDIDFIKGNALNTDNQREQNLSLCYARPITNQNQETTVLTTDNRNPRKLSQETNLAEDGLYASDSPFIYSDIKFSQFSDTKIVEYESKNKFHGKLIEIVIRDANINTLTDETIEITSVSLLFKRKIICKANRPFNRKLHKLLIRNKEYSNLSIQVYIKGGQSSILPLPLPKHNIENSKVEIDFAISDNLGRIHAGTVICTVSVNNYGEHKQEPYTFQVYKLSNDPNDPQNNLSLFRLPKNISKKEVKYFLLEDRALMFDTDLDETFSKKTQTEEVKSPDIVVTEQPVLSLLNTLFRNLFQIKQPLESSSGTRRHHTIGKTILAVTILRGIEIPIREESAFVQPFIEVEWGNTVHATSVAEGPAPVWQQTVQFELPRQNDEYCIKFRLYDLHPVWGQQWLGEARIPLELHRNYQELERWITLSPLLSPVLLFGYIQACPGQSCARIYVLIKIEHPNTAKSIESTATNTLLKSIQRCLVTPYKINGLENPKDAARTVMFLPSLPTHYGPITPRQALNIRKVDHYGRAALLAVLLQSFDLQTYVLLGSSQISKVTAFVLSISSNGIYMLWDPETGNYHKLDDSHCPLMKVTRLINHFGMWENLQKSILPHNLKYDVKSSKEWRPIDIITSGKTDHNVQTIEVHITDEEVKHIKRTAVDIEQCLKDKLAYWRSKIGLTTIFNRHATAILRSFISQIEPFSEIQLGKKDLKQLYRAYHIHGFVLNKRECPVDELCKDLYATKIHDINGPVEFAVVSHVQPYIGKICSIWIAIIILRSHD